MINVTLPVERERKPQKGDTIDVHTLQPNGQKLDASQNYDNCTHKFRFSSLILPAKSTYSNKEQNSLQCSISSRIHPSINRSINLHQPKQLPDDCCRLHTHVLFSKRDLQCSPLQSLHSAAASRRSQPELGLQANGKKK